MKLNQSYNGVTNTNTPWAKSMTWKIFQSPMALRTQASAAPAADSPTAMLTLPMTLRLSTDTYSIAEISGRSWLAIYGFERKF